MIKSGYYRHYKGGIYQVLFIAKDSETLEDKVIYRAVDGQYWNRPIEMWSELIDGVPRFKLLNPRDGWRQFEKAKQVYRQQKEDA